MDRLHFATQFFHFTPKQWEKLLPLPDGDWMDALFSGLTPRTLRCGPVRGPEHAFALYEEILREEASIGLRIVKHGEPDYPPALLKALPEERQPLLLFLRGPNPPLETELVAIVGTRSPSTLGRRAARNFSAYFTMIGLRVVSGLARGIDALAHEENLRNGTIAVLGSGVSEVYPQEHQGLAERILARGGTLLSQFPIWQVPLPQNFPQRNELISALAAGTVVVEGSEKSGAAITGKLSLSQGKAVVALAQDFRTAFGRGAIRLEQAGATLVVNEEEALHALYARLGGFPWPLAERAEPQLLERSFDFAEFHGLAKTTVPEAIVLLEEGMRHGRIERLAHDCYRFRAAKPEE